MNPVKGLQNKSLGLESGQYVTQQLLEGSQAPFTVKDLLYRCSPCGLSAVEPGTVPQQMSLQRDSILSIFTLVPREM